MISYFEMSALRRSWDRIMPRVIGRFITGAACPVRYRLGRGIKMVILCKGRLMERKMFLLDLMDFMIIYGIINPEGERWAAELEGFLRRDFLSFSNRLCLPFANLFNGNGIKIIRQPF